MATTLYSTGFESDADGWATYFGGATTVRDTAQHNTGIASLRVAGGSPNVAYKEWASGAGILSNATKVHTVQIVLRPNGVSTTASLRIEYYNGGGGLIRTDDLSVQFFSDATWHVMGGTTTPPAGVATSRMSVFTDSTQTIWVDDVLVTVPDAGTSVAPGVIGAVVSMPAPKEIITAKPASISAVVSMPAPLRPTTVTPSTIAVVASIPTPGISIPTVASYIKLVNGSLLLKIDGASRLILNTYAAASISVVVSMPSPSVASAPTPAAIAAIVAMPSASGRADIKPSTIAVVVAMPAALGVVSLPPTIIKPSGVISEELDRNALIDEILSGPHTLRVKGIIMVNGVDYEDIDDIEGTIRSDGDALITRTLQLTLSDPKRFPLSINDLIAPPNEIRIEVTISNWRGEAVTEPAGVFVLSEPKMTMGAMKRTMTVNCFDRSRFVQRNRWPQPTPVAADIDVAVFLRAMITDRDPFAEFGVWPASIGVPTVAGVLGVQTSNDPLADLVKVALNAGWKVVVDRRGQWTMYPVPNPNQMGHVRRYSDRDPLTTFLEATRSFSDVPGYNGVVGRSDPPAGTTSLPLFSEAWNNDLSSRTNRYGRWRPVPKFWASPLVYDQATLDAAVLTLQRSLEAEIESVQWTCVADPRRVPDEMYEIERPLLGLNGRVMSSQITLPLNGQAMTIVAVDRTIG